MKELDEKLIEEIEKQFNCQLIHREDLTSKVAVSTHLSVMVFEIDDIEEEWPETIRVQKLVNEVFTPPDSEFDCTVAFTYDLMVLTIVIAT